MKEFKLAIKEVIGDDINVVNYKMSLQMGTWSSLVYTNDKNFSAEKLSQIRQKITLIETEYLK